MEQGSRVKILKRIEYSSIVEYAKKENISFIYMRSDHNANPFTIHMVHQMRKRDKGCNGNTNLSL